MSLVLADIDDFAEVGPKPLDREQFWESARMALTDGKREGRKIALVLANIDDSVNTIKTIADQAHFLIIEGKYMQDRFLQ